MNKPPSSLRRPLSLRCSHASGLALGLSAALAAPLAAAQDDAPIRLDALEIEERTIDTNPYAEPGAPYKARVSGDARHVKPLAETPQTIQVLTQTQVQDSGRDDLREVLAAQPGITLGTGENGNAFGDRYIIRGHEARSDVFVDGLRDPGMTTRESFVTEQIEITKGPSSTFAGRGSTGGAINSVTKQASPEYDFVKLQGGLGTDDYRRLSADVNKKLSETAAVRVNLLHAYEEVPDRGPAERDRNGVALSGAVDLGNGFEVVADYYYLDAKDRPDLGSYMTADGAPDDHIASYSQDEDFLESTINTGTLRLRKQFAENLRLENATRYGTTDNGYVVTGARGTVRDASDTLAPGAATISLSTHQGWQEVEYFVNQFNLYWDTTTGNVEHKWVFGVEYSDLGVINGNYTVDVTGASNCRISGRGGVSDGYCIVGPTGDYIDDMGGLMQRDISRAAQDIDYNVKTVSVYAMDTMDLTDKLSLFLGLRADRFEYENILAGRNGDPDTLYEYDDTLFNGHVGAVYQLTEAGNVYATVSTSSEINGGESDVGGSCGYGGLCGTPEQVTENEPETTYNLELGSKWNLLDEKLLLQAALFQITKKDVMESLGDNDYESIGTINTGENRVRGFEVSLSGNLSERLSTQFGFTLMDAEILDSINEAEIGKTLSNFSDNSVFLQARYQFTPKFAAGAIWTYNSEQHPGQPDAAAAFNAETGRYSHTVPDYSVLDLFARYDFNDNMFLRLNVNNVADEDYYLAAYRSGAFIYKGDARRAYLTFGASF